MARTLEERCESYKKELERYLSDNQITINEYCESLCDAFILDVLFPKTETELRNAKKAFSIYKTLRFEIISRSKSLDDNTAYLIKVMSIEGLNEKSKYDELAEMFDYMALHEEAEKRYHLDTMVAAESDEAATALTRLILPMCHSIPGAEKILEVSAHNLNVLEIKAARKAIKADPIGMLEKTRRLNQIQRLPSIKRYIKEFGELESIALTRELSKKSMQRKLK